MANESGQPVQAFGIVVGGLFVSARIRDWTSKATGEKGSTPELQIVLEDGGEPSSLDLDEKLLRTLKTTFKLGQPVRLRCKLGGMSRLTAVEILA